MDGAGRLFDAEVVRQIGAVEKSHHFLSESAERMAGVHRVRRLFEIDRFEILPDPVGEISGLPGLGLRDEPGPENRTPAQCHLRFLPDVMGRMVFSVPAQIHNSETFGDLAVRVAADVVKAKSSSCAMKIAFNPM